ncbi:hypothetical protein GCM10010411_62570 [Actinomadura fulvescens]|uniref:Uncharacterized protein n=1 Tax=Actinomadura fulvescens TaxID=46160 RepID=A0ABP6CKG9_9ACTN
MGMDARRSGDTPRETDLRRAQIWALSQALKSHGYESEIAESDPILDVPAVSGPPVRVRCEHRSVCGGELWFFHAGGTPVAPAGAAYMQDVIVAVKGKLASQDGR